MSTSRIYREWLRRIEAGEATTAQIRQLAAWALGSGRRTNLTDAEGVDVFDRVKATPIGLPSRDVNAGLAWMRRNGAKRLGLDAAVTHAVVDFRWSGEIVNYSNWTTVPVWIAVLNDGRTFRYYTVSWQAQAYGTGYTDPEWAGPVKAVEVAA